MIITIQQNSMTAQIDSFGAQLISLQDGAGKEFIWQRDPSIWQNCSPLLFPIVGNCRNNKTIIEGQKYEIPKHGFCKDTDFTVSSRSDASVTFQITDTEATRAVYPYAFTLSLTYALTDAGLTMDYVVANKDSRPIHYCLGAHPGFVCPLAGGEAFEDYVLRFEKKETLKRLVYDIPNLQFDDSHHVTVVENSDTIPLTYSMFNQDAVYFDELESRSVSIVNPATGKGVEVSHPDFATVAFWTPSETNAPFLCVEPWNGSGIYASEDDQFVHKNHLQTLEIGESKNYHLGIRIL